MWGWKPSNAMRWLATNPNCGEDRKEQEKELLGWLRAEEPEIAAAHVLNAISSWDSPFACRSRRRLAEIIGKLASVLGVEPARLLELPTRKKTRRR
jgi:hypothetical protein